MSWMLWEVLILRKKNLLLPIYAGRRADKKNQHRRENILNHVYEWQKLVEEQKLDPLCMSSINVWVCTTASQNCQNMDYFLPTIFIFRKQSEENTRFYNSMETQNYNARTVDVMKARAKENLPFDNKSKQVVFLFLVAVFSKRNRKRVHCVSIELKKHSWK